MNLASFQARRTDLRGAPGPLEGAPATACRLIVDGPGEGAAQMALDEVLLESAAGGGVSTLRFYRWSEPTVSLGYFQAYAERASHAASRDCAVVRRQTGGGAIVHDAELTYCLALGQKHPLAGSAEALYRASHAAIARALAACGVAVMPAGEADAARGLTRSADGEPFLCFQRRGAFDLVFDGAKVVGSAQRRRRGAVLEHGSVLLARSPHAPELAGILELTGSQPELAVLIERLAGELAAQLGLSLEREEVSAAEREAAGRLVCEKYQSSAWNRRR